MAENNTNPDKKPNKSYAYESAKVLSVAFELGFVIALPIVGFGLLGKWLDQKQGTHYFIYIGIVVAIIATSVTVYRRFAALIEKLRVAAKIDETQIKKDETK